MSIHSISRVRDEHIVANPEVNMARNPVVLLGHCQNLLVYMVYYRKHANSVRGSIVKATQVVATIQGCLPCSFGPLLLVFQSTAVTLE